MVEFCVIKGNFASITLDLLPKNLRRTSSSDIGKINCQETMADLLQKAIQSMSLEEEEPLTLPDSPRFRVIDESERSLLGRLLNPDCQSMARMIDYMPTAWRVYGRVRGIALSRERFQFVFQREEDLQTVLNDRPWSYNYWTMVLERWTPKPPQDFLQHMDIWIRMRNIPAVFFTAETMHKLASEVGKVEVIAYDPKVSHTKDYIRALVRFDTNKPAKATRKLNVPEGGTVTIEFDYEKIHKRCFHCLRLTHEKIKCPLLKRGVTREQKSVGVSSVPMKGLSITEPMEGPPGFPALFPELSSEDRKMAMLYISHADETERRARIERVKQGIEENKAASSVHLTRITKELDKGKGHVFSYTELLKSQHHDKSMQLYIPQTQKKGEKKDEDIISSSSEFSTSSAPLAPMGLGFQLGPSSEGRVIGNTGAGKSQKRRRASWKRRVPGKGVSPFVASSPGREEDQPANAKRKAVASINISETKNKKLSDLSVASVLKPLLPQ